MIQQFADYISEAYLSITNYMNYNKPDEWVEKIANENNDIIIQVQKISTKLKSIRHYGTVEEQADLIWYVTKKVLENNLQKNNIDRLVMKKKTFRYPDNTTRPIYEHYIVFMRLLKEHIEDAELRSEYDSYVEKINLHFNQ